MCTTPAAKRVTISRTIPLRRIEVPEKMEEEEEEEEEVLPETMMMSTCSSEQQQQQQVIAETEGRI